MCMQVNTSWLLSLVDSTHGPGYGRSSPYSRYVTLPFLSCFSKQHRCLRIPHFYPTPQYRGTSYLKGYLHLGGLLWEFIGPQIAFNVQVRSTLAQKSSSVTQVSCRHSCCFLLRPQSATRLSHHIIAVFVSILLPLCCLLEN